MNTELVNPRETTHQYLAEIKDQTLKLRSKLTCMMLFIEDAELNNDTERCLLNFGELLNKKNNELLDLTNRMKDVSKDLFKNI